MHYTRFENNKESGKAALILLAERENAQATAHCTTLDNCAPAPLKALEK
jgi:hypothetical protein